MTMNTNVKLEIRNGEGITFGIDRQLDKEFNQNVTLKGSIWNNIMNIVKNDNATNTKQYSGGDSDINNGNHYVVKEGIYELSQNAWGQIKTLVASALNLPMEPTAENTEASVKPEDVAVETGEQVAVTSQKKDENIKDVNNREQVLADVLDELNKKADGSLESKALVGALITKYQAIKSVAEDNGQTVNYTDMITRLTNYAKGREFQLFGLQASLGDDVTYNSECAKAKTLPVLKASYNQFANEYIEYFDKDGNGKIGLYEMFYENLVSNYLNEGLTPIEAAKKAMETTNSYLQKQYDVMNLPEGEDNDAITFKLVVNKFVNVESLVDTKIDSELDATEIAPYLHAMANLESGNNITGKEYRTMQYAEFENDGNFEKFIKKSKEFLDGIQE